MPSPSCSRTFAQRRVCLPYNLSMIRPAPDTLLARITTDPTIFGGKPIIRGRRLAVEHVLGMLAAGDSIETILAGYPFLVREDVLACLAYAHRLVGHERVDPALTPPPISSGGAAA